MRDDIRRASFNHILHLTFVSLQEVHHLVRLLRSVHITANVADSMARLFTDDKPNKAILSHLFLIFLGWAV